MASSWEQFEVKKQLLVAAIKQVDGDVALAKKTSNLFRKRQQDNVKRLDVRNFHGVIEVDVAARTVEVEGMTRFDELVDATLAHDLMPAVVPQLRSITIGGAIAGLGIESSSFRLGLVHETLIEFEVLLGDGSVVVVRADNEHKELFYGFPNSYATLGYVLRAKLQLFAVKPFVELHHVRFDTPSEYFKAVEAITQSKMYNDQPVDFLDGVVFEPGEQYLTLGRMVDVAPHTSDYTWLNIYYRSIWQRSTDYLSVKDYIWRWDTDWFWCSKNIPGVSTKLGRLLLGRRYLRSTTYWKLMALDQRYQVMAKLDKLIGKNGHKSETIIQDVEIPLDRCEEFLEFFQNEINIRPVWICPLKTYDAKTVYPLYSMDPQKVYVNFGFWDTIATQHEAGHYNRLLEAKVEALGGRKSLYSDSFYSREQFWELYNKPAYDKLKDRYDPGRRFKDLYDKCVKNS